MEQKVTDLYCSLLMMNNNILLVYKRKTKLHWIRIFFATPTFDLITKEEKANFEDKVSAIGGTMGLLTGFSIISGVKIIYFLVVLHPK